MLTASSPRFSAPLPHYLPPCDGAGRRLSLAWRGETTDPGGQALFTLPPPKISGCPATRCLYPLLRGAGLCRPGPPPPPAAVVTNRSRVARAPPAGRRERSRRWVTAGGCGVRQKYSAWQWRRALGGGLSFDSPPKLLNTSLLQYGAGAGARVDPSCSVERGVGVTSTWVPLTGCPRWDRQVNLSVPAGTATQLARKKSLIVFCANTFIKREESRKLLNNGCV